MEIVQKLKECDGCYDRLHLNKLLAEFVIEKGNVNSTSNSQEMEKGTQDRLYYLIIAMHSVFEETKYNIVLFKSVFF